MRKYINITEVRGLLAGQQATAGPILARAGEIADGALLNWATPAMWKVGTRPLATGPTRVAVSASAAMACRRVFPAAVLGLVKPGSARTGPAAVST
jgi:hypothetical protein